MLTHKGILMTIKSQLKKVYRNDKITLNRKDSDDNFICYKIEEPSGYTYNAKVEVDNEDHDWWVWEQYEGEWKREHIITL